MRLHETAFGEAERLDGFFAIPHGDADDRLGFGDEELGEGGGDGLGGRVVS
jgi:hypothetical protein